MARPALTEPPGELMYRLMAPRGSSADSSSSWAQSRLATASSTSVPRRTMRWNMSRLMSCSSRPAAVGGAATASFMISLLSVWSPDPGSPSTMVRPGRPGQGNLLAAEESVLRPSAGRPPWSLSGGVTQVHRAVGETPFRQQFEGQVRSAGEGLLAAAHHDGADDQVALVDQAGLQRLGGQHRAADRDVPVRARFQLPDRRGVEVPLDPGPGGADRLQRAGEHDLVRGPPDLGEVEHQRRLPGLGQGLPAGHFLIQPPSVEVGPDRPLEVVDEAEHLVVGPGPGLL